MRNDETEGPVIAFVLAGLAAAGVSLAIIAGAIYAAVRFLGA